MFNCSESVNAPLISSGNASLMVTIWVYLYITFLVFGATSNTVWIAPSVLLIWYFVFKDSYDSLKKSVSKNAYSSSSYSYFLSLNSFMNFSSSYLA